MQNTMTMTAEDWGRRIGRANLWPAALLLLLLIALWLLGLGPRADCCAPLGAASQAAPTTAGALAPPAAPSVASTAPVKVEPLSARLEADGKLILTGTVASEAQRKALLDAATARVGAGNVVDRLVVGTPPAAVIRLEGEVADEATRGAWTQAFTQPGLELDNRLQVRAAPLAPQAAASPVAPSRIYFRTGKTDIDAAGAREIARMAEALKANPGRKAVISGFHDDRGDPARNAELAKRRAQAVAEALRALGIDAGRIELRKPSDTLGGADRKEARRVELSLE